MEKEEHIDDLQLQSLTIFGIFKESFRIILSFPKIFTQISLSLILPLSFIFLSHFQISQLIFFKILTIQTFLHRIPRNSTSFAKISDLLFSQWIFFCLFKFAYFTFFLTLWILSTSAVVSTVAAIYASNHVTFGKVVTVVVPNVWNRLTITFNWNFALVSAYTVISGMAFIGANFLLGFVFGIVLLILCLIGFLYIIIIWHLASVISVLEDSYGREAMIKSRGLIKGKMGTAIVVSFLIFLCFLGIQLGFETFVVIGLGVNGEVIIRIGIAILCLIFLLKVILFGLVIQTVLYFVCKSYHHEIIDNSSLANHLEDYLGDYGPVKGSKDAHLPQEKNCRWSLHLVLNSSLNFQV